jgi:dienelactone hydrolase
VATVNANGAITAVAVGSTYVVATLPDRPEVRDSVRVRVHADSCTGTRPDFGGMATAEDRALFSYDVDAPLNLQKTVESTNNGVEVSTVSFSSPAGGLVIGKMWDPVTRSGLRPGIVLMHGLPGNASSRAGLAQLYAQHGAVVIAIDAPWNRRAAPPYLTITAQDRAEQIQVVKDLQRAVDVLRSRPNVDDDRIAYVGFSWGGATGALFVGIERRLKAAALVVGHGGQVSHATGPEGHKLIANVPCARRVAWIRAMAPIEPIRFVGHANVPLLLQNGRFDELVPGYEAEELHAAAPQPKEVRWYDAGHNLSPTAALDRHRWLHEKIGLDAPAGG